MTLLKYASKMYTKTIKRYLCDKHKVIFEIDVVDIYSIKDGKDYIINVKYSCKDNIEDTIISIINRTLSLREVLRHNGFLKSFIKKEIDDLNTYIRIINKEEL